MKFLFLVASALLTIPSFATNLNQSGFIHPPLPGSESPSKKIYISPEDIEFENQKIFFWHQNHYFPAAYISSDVNGLFAVQEGVFEVYCSKCATWVDLDNQSPTCPHPYFVKN